MNEHTSNIDFERIAKYLAGEMLPAESAAFENEMQASPALAKEVSAIQNIWANVSLEDDIDVSSAWEKVNKKMPQNSSMQGRSTYKWMRMAASIAIITIVSAALWFLNIKDVNVYKSAESILTQTMSDGTEIILDSHSTLEYASEFNIKSREVWLNGNAYFQVASNADLPFIVHTDAGDVRVVGTAFDVITRSKNAALIVDVEEGIVQVNNAADAQAVKITAGQRATMPTPATEIQISENNTPDAGYWRTRTLRFRKTALDEVCRILQQTHGIDIMTTNHAILDCELSATFKDESPDEIMEVIAATLGLQLQRNGSQYILQGEGCGL